jgi:hypothetical protein
LISAEKVIGRVKNRRRVFLTFDFETLGWLSR